MNRRLGSALLHLDFTRTAFGRPDLNCGFSNGGDKRQAGAQAISVVFAF